MDGRRVPGKMRALPGAALCAWKPGPASLHVSPASPWKPAQSVTSITDRITDPSGVNCESKDATAARPCLRGRCRPLLLYLITLLWRLKRRPPEEESPFTLPSPLSRQHPPPLPSPPPIVFSSVRGAVCEFQSIPFGRIIPCDPLPVGHSILHGIS